MEQTYEKLFAGILYQAKKDYVVYSYRKKKGTLAKGLYHDWKTARDFWFEPGVLEEFLYKYSVQLNSDYLRRMVKKETDAYLRAENKNSYFKTISQW